MPVFELFHFWTRYPGTAEAFFGAVLLALWFCASASTLLQEGPGSPVHVEQSALDTTPFFQRQSRLPPTATKTVRSNSSAIVENLLRSTASKLPATGSKSNTGEDGCSYMAFGSKVSSQCWPRCAPQCLLLLWGALEGLGRLSSLEGEACPQAAGPDLFSKQGAGWDTVDSGFRRAGLRLQSRHAVYLGTAPRHIWVQSLSGRAGCAMGVGLRLRPSQLCSLLSCYRRGSGSARSDGLFCALTTNHPYGPSLVVGSYLVWDATRRELWETALLSTTRRLPVREYWTQ